MSQQRISQPPLVSKLFALPLGRTFLILAWAGWILGVVSALGLFVISLPIRLHQLVALSLQATTALRHGPPSLMATVLQQVLSINVYPVFVLTEEVVLVAGLTLVGLVLFWRKPKQWHGTALLTCYDHLWPLHHRIPERTASGSSPVACAH